METSSPTFTSRPRRWARPLLLLALAIALAAGVAWWMRPPHDPGYDGRSLADWLSDPKRDLAWHLRDRPHALGPDAVRWLAWAIEHGSIPPLSDSRNTSRLNSPSISRLSPRAPSKLQQTVESLWLKVFKPRGSPGYNERWAALKVLPALGPDAEPAIPALLRLMHHPDELMACGAAKALIEIGPAAWPAIERSFHDGNQRMRLYLVRSLSKGTSDRSTPAAIARYEWRVNFALQALTDPDQQVRTLAAARLALMTSASPTHPARDAAGAALQAILAGHDPDARIAAVGALVVFSFHGAAYAPDLIKLLDDPNPDVRHAAIEGLMMVDLHQQQSKSRLRQMTDDPDDDVRKCARAALSAFLGRKPAQPPKPVFPVGERQRIRVIPSR